MLLYHNRSIIRLIFARIGSIIRLRNVFLGSAQALLSEFLAYLIKTESDYAPAIPNNYGIVVIGGIVSFAIIYRMNLGWQRYWDAVGQQHFMYSKWADAYAQFFSFCQVSMASIQSKGGADSEKKICRIEECLDRVERNFGLLSAMSAHRLTCGDNERMSTRSEMGASWNDQVIKRHKLRNAQPELSDSSFNALPELTDYRCKNQTTSKISQPCWNFVYRLKQVPTADEVDFLSETKDRVSAVMYWIIHDLSQVSGDLIIAPPIQSRMYQELSNGMLGFNHCLKIADVPFPFPYAQLLTWMLIAFTCLLPFYVAVFTTSLVMSPFAAFFACVGVWSINEVAIELENPFGNDDNDISCGDFHERFLDSLIEQRGAHHAKAKAEKILTFQTSRENTGLSDEIILLSAEKVDRDRAVPAEPRPMKVKKESTGKSNAGSVASADALAKSLNYDSSKSAVVKVVCRTSIPKANGSDEQAPKGELSFGQEMSINGEYLDTNPQVGKIVPGQAAMISNHPTAKLNGKHVVCEEYNATLKEWRVKGQSFSQSTEMSIGEEFLEVEDPANFFV